MFQWLMGSCACVQAFSNKDAVHGSLVRIVLLALLFFQNPGVAVAAPSSPAWTVPVQLTSDDGYAFLDWTQPEGSIVDFFKIIETFDGKQSVHYTDVAGLRAWRVTPGEYDFVVRACVKNINAVPECGHPSRTLSLEVTEAVTSTVFTRAGAETNQTVVAANIDGGPDQLKPGHWYNPAKSGHGWNFYWSNRLALPQNDPLFGNAYDLIGIWYTYEAKFAQAVVGCSSCPPNTEAYRPVVLKLKAISTGPGIYGGSLYVSRSDGSEIWVGSADVIFESNNSNATVNWNANFKKESLSDSDQLTFLHGSDPTDTNNISFHGGLWESKSDDGFYVAMSMGQTAEVATVVFHDDIGDPTWIQAVRSGTPVSGPTDHCYAYLIEGYSPQSDKPADWTKAWHLSGCDPSLTEGATNRNSGRYFPDLNKQNFWADFTLPGTNFASGSISIGSSSSPVTLEKAASFHGVEYNSATGSSCDLAHEAGTCEVQLTWYTDGNYPGATVFAHNHSDDTFHKVGTSTQASMVDIPYLVPGQGVYDFELRMGDGVETALMAKSAVFTVIESVTNGNPETPPAPASPPSMTASTSSSKVGATAGEFRVDESGSATYSIPILTAPASGGVAPQISLNYSSQAGNGDLGVGWALGGVSAISRCPQTMEQDAISGSRGINLDDEDRFCLDGQRLIVDATSGEYGKHGTQYRTEIDSFARITSLGTAGNGPAWFKVERKDGSVIEYGNSGDSRIEARGSKAPSTAFTWAQNRFEDRTGNYILYSYRENNSGPVAYVLQAIDYTGNVRAGTLPSARLSFTYSDRSTSTDLSFSYFAGAQLEQSYLLHSIRSQGRLQSGSPLEDLRFYELSYGEDGVGRKILTALTECRSASRAVCYQPTRFTWLKSESKIETSTTTLSGLLPRKNLSGLLLADVSGDGRPDLLYTKSKSKNHFLYVKESTAIAGFNDWGVGYQLPKKSDGSSPRVFAIDINSDGIQDLVYSKYSKTSDNYTWAGLVSTGSGFSAETELNPGNRFSLEGDDLESRIRIMDFNGDGLSDILHVHTTAEGDTWRLVVQLNSTVPGSSPSLVPPIELDVDNSDLFPSDNSGEWGLSHSTPLFNWEFTNVGKTDAPDTRIFDFNGDGAVDLLLKVWRDYQRCISNCVPEANARGSNGGSSGNGGNGGNPAEPVYEYKTASFWVLMESTGQNAYRRHSIVALGEDCTITDVCGLPEYEGLPRSDHVWPVDINADGLADLAWGSPGGNWYFQLNNGRDFLAANSIGQIPLGTNELVRFEDWNGDAFPDLVYPSGVLDSNAKWMVVQNHFGRAFATATNTLVLAGNVGGDSDHDPVENDASIFADFDGDGKTDQLLINNNKSGEIISTQLRKGINVSGSRSIEPANVITTITNGFGAVTQVAYRPLTDDKVYTRTYNSVSANWGKGAPVYDYIAPIFVVNEVSVSSPVFGNPDARSGAEYHYVGAKLQAGGRGLLGFAEIIVYDSQLQVRTNTRYRQDFPYIGLPVDSARAGQASGSKFSPITPTSSTGPTIWPALTSTTKPPSSISGKLLSYNLHHWRETPAISGARQIYPDSSLSRSYTLSGNLESKVLTQNSFDSFGNMTNTIISMFPDDGTVPFSRRTTSNHWSTAYLPNWTLGRLDNSTVTHTRTGKSSVIRKSAFEYENASGVLTKEIIEPGNAKLSITTTFTYDSFGNRKVTSKKGAGMNVRTSSVAFDSLGRFVIRETNALGQVFRKVNSGKWDVFGNPLEIENIDGVVSKSGVDLMGRSFASHNETGAWQKTLNYKGNGSNCPTGTLWYNVTTGGGGTLAQQCFDVIGRSIRKVGKDINNQMIYVDQFYDKSGRLSRVSEPYFKNDTRYWNETAYDRLGRVTGLLSAGGDDISTDYDEQASNACTPAVPRVIVITNALGQRSTEVKNVLGETTKSFDDNCGQISFNYDSMGHLTRVTGEDGAVVSMSYDGAGRKISLSDPDKGNWQYAYNPLGELTRQLDSKHQAIDFEYDALGRVNHRRELAGVTGLTDSTFTTVNHEKTTYRTASPGKSQPATITYFAGESGAILHQRDMSYDWLGRVSDVSSTVGNQQFYQQTTYDAYGRVFQQFDASGNDRGLRYVYSYGHLSQLKEAREGVNGLVYQDVLEMDARGNITRAKLGNGVMAVADHNPANGHLVKLSAYDQSGVELQDVDYLFDVLGNLKSRHDLSASNDLKENFAYDELNRLVQVNLTAPALGIASPVETLALDYSASGNITWKSDVGAYTYGSGAGPHAVTHAGNATYSYDLNGNQLSGDGRIITYTLFDKASSLTAGNQITTFTYGIGNQRVKRQDSTAGVVDKSTVYLGNVEFITGADGSTLFKRYLGGVAIATYYPTTSIQQTSYLLKDHIGSIHTVLDEDGLISTRMHFSPFGDRQDANWQTPLDSFLYSPLNDLTTRGFTGHEHVDSMGIIHMNGRIYDTKLGRFLQADPIVQEPKNGQYLNRYSYVLNNPLSYSDPSGYFSFSRFIKKWGRVIVAAVASYFTFGAAYAWAATSLANAAATGTFVHSLAMIKTTAAVIGGATSGFVGGAIISGTLKGAVKGAFAGAITGGIAKYYGDTYSLGRVASESIGGGISARILGGKFEDGLKFALIVSGMTYLNYRMDLAERSNSAQPGTDNLNKPGSGLYGQEHSIAGARRTIDPKTGNYLPCGSPAGGCQSLPLPGHDDQLSNLAGMPYNPKGSIGYVVDTFAGPHDWLRNHVSRSYDVLGNSRYFTGVRRLVDQVANAALIPAAAPFSMAALIGTQPSVYITALEYTYGD